MTRPTKIRIALALVLFGALAWAVWPGEEKGEVSLTFAGVSTTNSHLLFTITNASKKSFDYSRAALRQTNGVWPQQITSWPVQSGTITNQGAQTVDDQIDETNRWRWVITYWDASATRFDSEPRMKLAQLARNIGWMRLSRWVFPDLKFKTIYGPEMLGNQPAPPDQP